MEKTTSDNRSNSKLLHKHLIPLGWDHFYEEHFETEDSPMTPARVVGTRKNYFLINTGEEEKLVQASGKLKKSSDSPFPSVGDWVRVHDSLITSVLPRKNILYRKAAGSRGKKNTSSTTQHQIIAANIDLVFIVCGLDRDFNPRRIERLLAMVYNCDLEPEIVLTKADLHDDPDSFLLDVEMAAPGVPIHLVSAREDDVLSAMHHKLEPHKTIALIGSSGAGKSTLINRLYGTEVQKTSEVSKSLGKGRHTTTNRDLLLIPTGGMVIDNPGIREIALELDQEITEGSFPEIDELAKECRFSNCTHSHEPGCNVLAGISNGTLSPDRLQSYQKLKNEELYHSQRETNSAAQVERSRWKGVAKKIKTIKNKR